MEVEFLSAHGWCSVETDDDESGVIYIQAAAHQAQGYCRFSRELAIELRDLLTTWLGEEAVS